MQTSARWLTKEATRKCQWWQWQIVVDIRKKVPERCHDKGKGRQNRMEIWLATKETNKEQWAREHSHF